MKSRIRFYKEIILLALLIVFVQGCSVPYEVDLENVDIHPSTAVLEDSATLGAAAESNTDAAAVETTTIAPVPISGIPNDSSSLTIEGAGVVEIESKVSHQALTITTKKNTDTLKTLKDFVPSDEASANDKQFTFSFSRTAVLVQLKTEHGNAILRQGIDGLDALGYQPDLNYLGKESFSIYRLMRVGEKLVVTSILDTEADVTDCTDIKLAIWSDANSDGKTDGLPPLGYISAYNGSYSAVENYNYFSASNHTKVGPPAIGFESHVFVYNNNDGMYLFFYFNVDEGGSTDNTVQWDITTKGNGSLDSVILSDDDLELNRTSQFQGDQPTNFYQGRFHYYSNTDGGVIGPFKGTNFEISAKVMQTGDLKRASFFSSDCKTFSLTDNNNALSSFILSFDSTSRCQ